MKVYVMLTDEPIDRRSLCIVGREDDAKKLIKAGRYYSYEVVEVLDSKEVNEDMGVA